MANQNYYENDKSKKDTTTEKKNVASQLTFNLIDAEPVSVKYVIDRKTAEKLLFNLASEALNDGNAANNVESAKFVVLRGREDDYVYDEKNKRSSSKPHISAQVIIPSRNGNLIAKSSGNEFIRAEDTTHYSDTFKSFVHTYCNDENKNVYITAPKRDRGISYRAIIIDIGKFFGQIFDYTGSQYKEAMGQNTPVDNIDLRVSPVYEYDRDHRAKDLVAFEITKSFQTTGKARDIVFDVYDTKRKTRYNDDDSNRDNGKRNYRNDYGK